MKIAISIFFDCLYLEPALVTAHEVIMKLWQSNLVHKIYLVYLDNNTSNDHDARIVIQNFCSVFEDKASILAISLRNTLGSFRSFHFNNSILYKSLIASMIDHEPFIMNLDAGILLGGKFDQFLQEIMHDLCTDSATWVVGAHCHSPDSLLSPDLMSQPHNNLYPAGTLIMFNSEQYKKNKWHDRYIGNYSKFQSYLTYAEQELMCLTATEGEIISLPGAGQRITPFLGLDVLTGKENRIASSCLDDCVYFKFVGSIKPWKYWVLDPNKSIYTRQRAILEKNFNLSEIPLIERSRISKLSEDHYLGFLRAYDFYLQNNIDHRY